MRSVPSCSIPYRIRWRDRGSNGVASGSQSGPFRWVSGRVAVRVAVTASLSPQASVGLLATRRCAEVLVVVDSPRTCAGATQRPTSNAATVHRDPHPRRVPGAPALGRHGTRPLLLVAVRRGVVVQGRVLLAAGEPKGHPARRSHGVAQPAPTLRPPLTPPGSGVDRATGPGRSEAPEAHKRRHREGSPPCPPQTAPGLIRGRGRFLPVAGFLHPRHNRIASDRGRGD